MSASSGTTRYYVIGTALQLAMVISGHFVQAIANQFAMIGTAIPLVIGVWYGIVSAGSFGAAAGVGLLIGAVPALIGVIPSYLMGDVPLGTIWFATVVSGVTALIGAVLGFAVKGRSRVAAAV